MLKGGGGGMSNVLYFITPLFFLRKCPYLRFTFLKEKLHRGLKHTSLQYDDPLPCSCVIIQLLAVTSNCFIYRVIYC